MKACGHLRGFRRVWPPVWPKVWSWS